MSSNSNEDTCLYETDGDFAASDVNNDASDADFDESDANAAALMPMLMLLMPILLLQMPMLLLLRPTSCFIVVEQGRVGSHKSRQHRVRYAEKSSK